jgi:iron complex outermembrane receptor protein
VKRSKNSLAICGGLTLLATATLAAETAAPADEILEVTVTARRVSENLERVPVAATVVDPALINTTPYFDVEDFTKLAVGLTATAGINSRNQAYFNIRGQMFGVVNYFDEVPITNPAPTAIGSQEASYSGITLDSAGVQVLRGPQGTLFGRNATGGAVLFQSQAPSNDFDASVEAGTGNYSLQDYQAMLNVPIIPDKLSVRLVADRTLRSGFTLNTFDNSTMDNLSSWDARASVLFTPIESLSNQLVFQTGKLASNGTGFQLVYVPPASVFRAVAPLFGLNVDSIVAQNLAGGPRVVDLSVPTGQSLQIGNTQKILVNTTKFEPNNSFTIKNIFGYYEITGISMQNFSGSTIPFYSGLLLAGEPATKRDQYTDELQLQYNVLDGKLQGVIGAFYGLNHESVAESGGCTAFFTPVPTCTVYEQAVGPEPKQTSKAGFTQATLDLSEWVLKGLKLTAGYRRTEDEVFSGAAVSFMGGPNFSLVQTACAAGTTGTNCLLYAPQTASFGVNTYNFDLTYQISDGTFTYITTRHGYRPGGFNSATAANTPFATFQPEYVTDYEIGLKSDFHLGTVPVRTNIAVYTGNYSNLQQNTTVDLSVYNGLPPNSQLGNVTQNAAKSTVRGVELEVIGKPVAALTLSGRINYIDAHYKDFVEIIQQPGVPLQPTDASAQIFPNTPQHTYGLTFDYDLPIPERIGSFSVGGNYYWQGKTEGAEGDTLFSPWAKVGAWSSTDFHAVWHNAMAAPLDVTLFLENAFNQVHVIDVEAPAVIAYRTNVYNSPRMYGVKFKYRFGKSAH